MYAKVKEHKNQIRDLDNFAVLNTDREALTKHEKVMYELNKDKKMQEEINTLKNDITEIKQLLQSLANRGS